MGIIAVIGSERTQALEQVAPGRTLTVTLADPARGAEQIERFARRHPLAAIIPTDEPTAVVASLASGRLALKHNPASAVWASRYKDRLRSTLRDAGVRTPAHSLIPSTGDPDAAAAAISYPCVLKPTFLAASRGVIRADSPAQFVRAFSRIRALLALPDVAARDPAAAGHILVEEFVPGAEVALEGLLSGSHLKTLAIFDKPDRLEGPCFEETIYVTPSRLPAEILEKIDNLAAAACEAIGLREGPVHAEFRINEQGVWVIEVAARSIGGLCARALRFGAGLSLEELTLLHAVGRDIAEHDREARPAGVMMIPIPRGGILREVRGQRAAAGVDGVADVTITATLGRQIVPLPEGSSYLGFIFARGPRPEDVEKSLREAHRRLDIVISDRDE